MNDANVYKLGKGERYAFHVKKQSGKTKSRNDVTVYASESYRLAWFELCRLNKFQDDKECRHYIQFFRVVGSPPKR